MLPRETQIFSDEDIQFAEVNNLGLSEGIYRLDAGYLRWMRRCLITTLILGVIAACFFFVNLFQAWQLAARIAHAHPHALAEQIELEHQQNQLDSQNSLLLNAGLAATMVLVFTPISLYKVVLQGRMNRIVVCEQGILDIRWDWKRTTVDVVRWEDIRFIKRRFSDSGYSLIRRESKPLILRYYQNMDDLIAQMSLRSGITMD